MRRIKSLTELIDELRSNENIINWHEIEPQEARTRPMPESVDDKSARRWPSGAYRSCILISIRHIVPLERANIVAVTPTASGKTLCYNLPVLQQITSDPTSRALYLFPDEGFGAGSEERAE